MTVEKTESLAARFLRQPQVRPFRERNFRYLWLGAAASLLGDGMFFVAVPWLVLSYRDTPSALAMLGVVMAVTAVPAALLTGSLERRFGARRVMIAADAIRAAVLITVCVLDVTGMLTLGSLLVAMGVFAAGEAIFVPAFGVMVQRLVAAEDLIGANAADQIIRPLMWRLIGPALGGVLVASGGAGTVFAADALTFVFSLLCLLRITEGKVDSRHRVGNPLVHFWEGWRYLWRTRWLFYAFLGGAVSVITVMGPWNVLVPYVIRNDMGLGADAYGLVLVAGGVGQGLAALFVGRRAMGPWAIFGLYLSWGLTAGGLAAFYLDAPLPAALAGSLVLNAALAVSAVLWYSIIQTAVPEELTARVFGLDWAMSHVLTPLSYLAASGLAAATSAREGLAIFAVTGLLLAPALLLAKPARHVETRSAE